MDLTVVVVTSPSWANPSLGLLPEVLQSLALVEGVETCSGGVVIVLDGYIVSSREQTKRGRVSQAMALNYELYHEALLQTYSAPRFRILRCPEHYGFAHAVKAGLEGVSTTFAMICQHDRAFIDTFDQMPLVL
jgi:hypothetical protein